MKAGERRPTLIAMSRTIAELDTDLELKRRENGDLRNESMAYQHRETDLRSKASRLELDLKETNNKLIAADTLTLKLQGQADEEKEEFEELREKNKLLIECNINQRKIINTPLVQNAPLAAVGHDQMRRILQDIRNEVPSPLKVKRSDQPPNRAYSMGDKRLIEIYRLCQDVLS